MDQVVLSSPVLDSFFFFFFNKELAQTCIYIGIICGCHGNAAIPEIIAVWKYSVIITSTEIQKKYLWDSFKSIQCKYLICMHLWRSYFYNRALSRKGIAEGSLKSVGVLLLILVIIFSHVYIHFALYL